MPLGSETQQPLKKAAMPARTETAGLQPFDDDRLATGRTACKRGPRPALLRGIFGDDQLATVGAVDRFEG